MYDDMNLIIDNKDIKISLISKILIGLFLIMIIFSLIHKVKIYDNYLAKIIEKDGEYYVRIFMQNDTTQIIFNNTFLIDNKEYHYEIINIEYDYASDNGGKNMVVDIKTNLDDKYLINNNYINIKQSNVSDSLFNIVIKRIKKGMNL